MRSTQSIVFALLFTTTVVCSQNAHACAPIPEYRLLANGERSYDEIKVLSEDVLIIWDAKTGTEHFVRRANFESDSKGFG
ncbi:MAG TPA: hypothetical protein EYN06_06950, partial [Myxococcales bacterium]|nr:hypothetical protein [Myxococcales bacterium]